MTACSALRWRLRDATTDAHARLDARLGPAFDDAAGYAAFLRGMHRFLRAALAATGGDPVIAASVQAIAQDLADLRLDPLDPAAPVAVPPGAACGWRYVVAGASLGARVLLPRARALGHDADHGARYLAAQAASDHWRTFLATLDAAPADGDRAACDGARAAFAEAEASMREAFDTVTA